MNETKCIWCDKPINKIFKYEIPQLNINEEYPVCDDICAYRVHKAIKVVKQLRLVTNDNKLPETKKETFINALNKRNIRAELLKFNTEKEKLEFDF